MASASGTPSQAGDTPSVGQGRAADQSIAELGELLHQLQEGGAADTATASPAAPPDNQLVQVRLGIASSLFAALRVQACAGGRALAARGADLFGVGVRTGPARPQRDAIEMAALLHDVGLIGVPDHVLSKPGAWMPTRRR